VVLTTGFGKLGDRQFRLWDLRTALSSQVKDPLSHNILDPGSGVVVPYVVEDNGAVVMTAKGEMAIRVFEIEGRLFSVLFLCESEQSGRRSCLKVLSLWRKREHAQEHHSC
jgi:hypothetical protein